MSAIPKVHLFIDTNILLSFYAYTNDDIEELRKLIKLITTNQLKLYLTQQVKDEFYRNRENKLKESLKNFQSFSAPTGIPRFMHGYVSIKRYRDALDELSKAKDEAIQQAKKEAKDGSIAADTLFEDISNAAIIINTTNKIYEAATRRMNLGNPPGKVGSLGDRINWEILLEEVPEDTDLHLISKDGDFGSPLLDAPNSYLVDEWRIKKNSSLHLHDQLKPFLVQYFPQIQLAIDVEKRVALDRLINSGSFATTHNSISNLQPFVDVLTPQEIDELMKAVENNPQIGWIAQDPDVSNFYSRIINIQYKRGEIEAEEHSKLLKEFGL